MLVVTKVVRVAGAVLRSDGRVLLCHRVATRDWYPGVWDIAGGHVEECERDWDALVRELAEELGIEVQQREFAPVARMRAGSRWKSDLVELTVWVVDSWQGEVRNLSPDEHDQLEWFGRDELPDLDLAHPAYLSLFSDLLAES